ETSRWRVLNAEGLSPDLGVVPWLGGERLGKAAVAAETLRGGRAGSPRRSPPPRRSPAGRRDGSQAAAGERRGAGGADLGGEPGGGADRGVGSKRGGGPDSADGPHGNAARPRRLVPRPGGGDVYRRRGGDGDGREGARGDEGARFHGAPTPPADRREDARGVSPAAERGRRDRARDASERARRGASPRSRKRSRDRSRRRSRDRSRRRSRDRSRGRSDGRGAAGSGGRHGDVLEGAGDGGPREVRCADPRARRPPQGFRSDPQEGDRARPTTLKSTSVGVRNLREMNAICVALDHLALGRTKRCADLLTQRFKAVEMAATEGHWDRAQYLELLESDTVSLRTKDEECMVTKEQELAQRVRGHEKPTYAGAWPKSGPGKGYQEYCQDKKGEAKGKEKKGKGGWLEAAFAHEAGARLQGAGSVEEWAGAVAALSGGIASSKTRCPRSSVHLLALAGRCNPTRLGCFERLLRVEPAQFRDFAARSALPPGGREAAVQVALGVVLGLKFLACAGWTATPICLGASAALSPPQGASVQRIWAGVVDFVEAGPYDFDFALVAEETQSKKGFVFRGGGFQAQVLVAALAVVAPRSTVHASTAEWYSLVKAAATLGLFEEVEEEDIFRNQFGDLILGGAMGVEKVKQVGESSEGETFSVDSEDMESCFNIFRVPPAWRGYFAFSKKVPRAAFGGPAAEETCVCIRSVPMGWIGAVDIMQALARRLVYETVPVDGATELRKDAPVPTGDVSLVCMGGFDYVSRVRGLLDAMGPGSEEGSGSVPHGRFVDVCGRLRIPLNVGKSVVDTLRTGILGGELDGLRGCLLRSRQTGHALAGKSLVLASTRGWPKGALQRWAGLFGFAAGFGRPLYSVLQEVFPFLADSNWDRVVAQPPPDDVLAEVLVGGLLLPMAFVNLRAPVRPLIKCSDASEEGAGAAVASSFVDALAPGVGGQAEDWAAGEAEESHQDAPVLRPCDRSFDSDAGRAGFSEAGGKSALERFDGEGVAFEHWNPGCPLDVHYEYYDMIGVTEYPFLLRQRCAGIVELVVDEIGLKSLAAQPSSRLTWLRDALVSSTARLAKGEVIAEAIPYLDALLHTMVQEKELDHLRELLRHADYRGSDVRLVSGQLVDGCRREFPCPAPAHIRYEAITIGTIHRYEVAILRFFQFLRLHDRVYPATLAELEREVTDACLAMASISLLWGWPRFGLSLLLEFLGFLRTGEILSIMKKQVSILGGGSLLVIALPSSKGAKRKGRPEYVRIHDTEVIRAVALLLGSLSPDERLPPGGFRQFSQLLEATAKTIGIAHPNLTHYTLRRGGATWHFSGQDGLNPLVALESAPCHDIYLVHTFGF
ncbi:unnamed protein product, partial [Prorocentrum cordatum]